MDSLFDRIMEWVRPALKTCIVALLVCTFVARPARVSGSSMFPTLADGDELILWSLGYTPEQGDIVACNCPGLNEIIVKRIVAKEGQSVYVDIGERRVYVDGEEFVIDGLEDLITDRESPYRYPITVPEGMYFVMGDNRQHSTDSRDERVGFIDREDILGKAVLRIFPFSSVGPIRNTVDGRDRFKISIRIDKNR